MSCDSILDQFLRQDFAHWRGLSADCTPEAIAAYTGDTLRRHNQYIMGGGYNLTDGMALRLKGYEEIVWLWYHEGKTVCLAVEFPELKEVPALLAALGKPTAELDCYYGVSLMRNREWVYADRGLTLQLNTDRSNVVALKVFRPMSLEEYKEAMYRPIPPREEDRFDR